MPKKDKGHLSLQNAGSGRRQAANGDALAKSSRAKDRVHEQRLFLFRSIFCALIVILSFGVILANTAHLTINKHEFYQTRSESNRIKREPIAPVRGSIYDRHGRELAINLPSHRLEIVPEHVEDKAALFDFLSKMLGTTQEAFDAVFDHHPNRKPYRGWPVHFRLTDAEMSRIAVELYRFPALQIRSDLTRHYPEGEEFAHILGYVGRKDADDVATLDASNYAATTHIGKIGIEKYYEDILHGEVGYRHIEENAEGREIREIDRTDPKPGKNLYLHLDIDLQKAAEEALGDFMGAALVMDVKDGAIYSMVSNPSFDPNLFVNGISHADFDILNTSAAKPMFNRVIYGQYPPGSTIKPMLGLAGLESQVYDAETSIYCPGYYSLPGNSHRYRDWKRYGHGEVDIHKAVVESCDVYYYNLAVDMGIDAMHEELSRYGFGRETGIDLSSERAGLLPSPEWKVESRGVQWYKGETVIAGIGQGYMTATPLQMVVSTAVVANDGIKPQPRLLYGVEEVGEGKMAIREPEFDVPVPVRNASNWRMIKDSMVNVVTSNVGTARKIDDQLLMSVAGKTGTSQVFSLGQDETYDEESIQRRLRDHALFVAYAPIKEPEIAVVVIVENGGSGGAVAAPIAKDIINAYHRLYRSDEPVAESPKMTNHSVNAMDTISYH